MTEHLNAYEGNEGLHDLLQQAADKTRNFIEQKTDVLRDVNRAASTYIEELKRIEQAKTCVQAWEEYALGVLKSSVPIALTADPEPTAIASQADRADAYSRIANDLIKDDVPRMLRRAS
jgi:hypothetical protein